MRRSSLLDPLLPKTRQGILAVTLMRPGKAWYAAELGRRLGVTPSGLRRELGSLARAGIVTAQRQGRMVHFRANVASPIYPGLRGLMLKTAGLADVLADALRPVVGGVSFALVHGAVAAGSEEADSDVALIVVGMVAPADLAVPLRQARDRLGRDVNPTVCTPADGRRRPLPHAGPGQAQAVRGRQRR